jgi:DNA-binding CsgD family transcriptional regulator
VHDQLDPVGLLTLYSNLSDQGERIPRLLELPERAPGEAARTPHSVRQRPTKAQREVMIAAYQTGETVRQIADRLGFHRDTVSATLAREGVGRRYHERRDVDLDQADELHNAGLSLTVIAEILGIGRTTLIKARRARS